MKWVAEDEDIQLVQKSLDVFGIFPAYEQIKQFIEENFDVAHELMVCQEDEESMFIDEDCVDDFVRWVLKNVSLPDISICPDSSWYLPDSITSNIDSEYTAHFLPTFYKELQKLDIRVDAKAFEHAVDNLYKIENQYDDENE